jgi:hypothetical protein
MRSVAHVLVTGRVGNTGSLIATELPQKGGGALFPREAVSLYFDTKIPAEERRRVNALRRLACPAPSLAPLTTGVADIRNPGSSKEGVD